MAALMQAASILAAEEVEYIIRNHPDYHDTWYYNLKFNVRMSRYSSECYITVNKAAPNEFIFTAVETGYCHDNKAYNVFDALQENEQYKNVLRFEDGCVIVPIEYLSDIVSWCM